MLILQESFKYLLSLGRNLECLTSLLECIEVKSSSLKKSSSLFPYISKCHLHKLVEKEYVFYMSQ